MSLKVAAKGLAGAPWWVAILIAAEEWGKFPWEIAPSTPPIVWWLRYRAYKDAIAQAEKEKVKKVSKRG